MHSSNSHLCALQICDFRYYWNSSTLFAVLATISLKLLLTLTFFVPSMLNLILADRGMEVVVVRREQVSYACFASIAAERVRDPRSLAGSWEALEGGDSGLTDRDLKTVLTSLSALTWISLRLQIDFSKLDGSELAELKRQFTRLTLAAFFSFRDFFVRDALLLYVIVFLRSVASEFIVVMINDK